MKIFKIRNRANGLFFKPTNRTKWGEKGKSYNKLGHARSSLRQVMTKYKIDRNDLEIVEYECVEKRTY